MPRAPQTKRRDSNDVTHMFITTYRLTTAFERSLLGIRSGTVAETKYFILSHGSTTLASLGLLYEVPRSIRDTPHSVTLLWKCDRPVTRWNEILTTQLITMNYLHQYGQFPVASKGCPCKSFRPTYCDVSKADFDILKVPSSSFALNELEDPACQVFNTSVPGRPTRLLRVNTA